VALAGQGRGEGTSAGQLIGERTLLGQVGERTLAVGRRCRPAAGELDHSDDGAPPGGIGRRKAQPALAEVVERSALGGAIGGRGVDGERAAVTRGVAAEVDGLETGHHRVGEGLSEGEGFHGGSI